MKHLFSILSLCLIVFGLHAQEPVVTWDGLKKQKEKSDASILDPAKAEKSATWAKRGKLYYDIAMFNYIPESFIGLPASGGIQNIEFLVGTPEKKEKVSDKEELWIYPQKKLYMKDGKLYRWEETDFIDKDALKKSAEAYIKADEKDVKGKFKTKATTKAEVMAVRNAVYNDALVIYEAKDNQKAFDLLLLCGKLSDFPRDDADTSFNASMPYYAAGIVARDMKKYDDARKQFQICADRKFQTDLSLHHSADTYLLQGDSAAYIAKVKESFDKYPESEQLIIDLINYYMDKNESETVIKYINLAIEKNPENASYYSAKGTIYDTQTDDFFKKYKEVKESAWEFKKLAFQNRFDAAKKAEYEKNQADALVKAGEMKAKKDEAFKNAEKYYKEALAKDPEFFNSIYNLGRLNYQAFEQEMYDSDYAFRADKDSESADKFKLAGDEKLKKSAEYFEQAHKMKPTDRNSIEMLRSIYYKLKDYEKAKAYKQKLDELPKENEGGDIK